MANACPNRERGYALVAVLWLLTLLSILTASYHDSARREARVLAGTVYETQARARAEAAIWIALSETLSARQRDIPARSTRTIRFDGRPSEVVMVEATGKINLNRAGEATLDRLLAHAELSGAERAALVDAILDWRDADGTRRPSGAEDADYAAAGHGANDSAFATVDELRHVRGMTETVFRRIAGVLTVHGDHTRVSAGAAGAEVLRSLSGGGEADVEAYLRERERADPSDSVRFDSAGPGLAQRVRGDAYTVRSTAAAGETEVTLEATLRIPRRGRGRVGVLEWN